MRTVTGYDGRTPVWSENVPSEAKVSFIAGSLVVAESGYIERARLREQQKGYREKAKAKGVQS